MAGSDDEEDDYLSMTFGEETKPAKETSLQRTARLKQEAAERGKIASKKELAEKERKSREEALATQLDSSNKGAKMMAKMGFKGGALGKTEGARTEPINLELKDDRGGIGMDSEKKRKVREAAEAMKVETKRQKVSEDEYRERNRAESEEKRAEGMWWAAMKVLEGFDTAGGVKTEAEVDDITAKATTKPLRWHNYLYRPLVKSRLEKEREARMRNDLIQSLSSNQQYDDPEADNDDRLSLGNEVEELETEEEDLEFDEYVALSSVERLERVVGSLREDCHYCFWCKFQYPDAEMDGCPGPGEDEHG